VSPAALVAMIRALPDPMAVTAPSWSTTAILGSEEAQVTPRSVVLVGETEAVWVMAAPGSSFKLVRFSVTP